ncbi:hypothetical protein T4D_11184 [Trichinella pseudospiralis]|uniref:Uncharacterized protein n=1 Tax=Trichinella pseudospiralis TaxID=6337 RepID=A0A0V1FT84_TRIPS|nr:hypothetical protein T4D_11184 [Trichinella pseudospiralis]
MSFSKPAGTGMGGKMSSFRSEWLHNRLAFCRDKSECVMSCIFNSMNELKLQMKFQMAIKEKLLRPRLSISIRHLYYVLTI